MQHDGVRFAPPQASLLNWYSKHNRSRKARARAAFPFAPAAQNDIRPIERFFNPNTRRIEVCGAICSNSRAPTFAGPQSVIGSQISEQMNIRSRHAAVLDVPRIVIFKLSILPFRSSNRQRVHNPAKEFVVPSLH